MLNTRDRAHCRTWSPCGYAHSCVVRFAFGHSQYAFPFPCASSYRNVLCWGAQSYHNRRRSGGILLRVRRGVCVNVGASGRDMGSKRPVHIGLHSHGIDQPCLTLCCPAPLRGFYRRSCRYLFQVKNARVVYQDGKSRGFAFVTFANPEQVVMQGIMTHTHALAGANLDVKSAVPGPRMVGAQGVEQR